MPSLLVLGAGYVGARVAELALERGDEVVLADDWSLTRREQVAGLESRGARVVTADVASREDVERALGLGCDRLVFLAAQASRPLAEREPDRTERTNATGARLVAETVAGRGGPPVVFGSSLHVYGEGLAGEVPPSHPYGEQRDLTHLTKVYAELALALHLRRAGVPLALMRLGIVYGPSPVEHDGPESVTVVDKFRRLAALGEPLPVEGGGRATIGVVHVEDAARILLECEPRDGVAAENVAAETITVADVAALAEGREPAGDAPFRFASPFEYRHRLADYLATGNARETRA